MNFSKLTSLAFAALLSVSAHGQIITNYGQGGVYSGSNWNGNWDGSTGQAVNASPGVGAWWAQTFTAPVAGSTTLYAYNFQLNIQSGTLPSFTVGIYEWSGSSFGSGVANTGALFNSVADQNFSAYGTNVLANGGTGTVLSPGALYAIVVHRTDTSTTGTVQVGMDYGFSGTPYSGGGAYSSTTGSTFSPVGFGTSDLAFWVSFDPNSLSPVPEPAVSGSLIGAAFVGALLMRRRRKQKAAPAVTIA